MTNYIDSIEELEEVLGGTEVLNEIFEKYKDTSLPYYSAGYDDKFDLEVIENAYRNWNGLTEEGKKNYENSFKYFLEEEILSPDGTFLFNDIEFEYVRDYVKEELLDSILPLLPTEEPCELSGDCIVDLVNRAFDYGIHLDLDSFMQQTMPEIEVNLMLATEREANYDSGSLYDMRCLAFGETIEGFAVTSFAEEDRDECKNTCDNMLTNVVYQQGHTLNEVFSGETTDNRFVNSIRQEIINHTYQMGLVTVLANMDFETFCDIADGKNFEVSKDAMIGIFNPWLGSGSLLDIELEKPLVINNDLIHTIQFESRYRRNWYSYTVDQVYGLIGSCWKDCVKTAPEGECFSISMDALEKDIIELKNGTASVDSLDNASYEALKEDNSTAKDQGAKSTVLR